MTFDEYLEACSRKGPMVREDMMSLRITIQGTPMMKLVGGLQEEINGQLLGISVLDLTTQSGVATAAKTQGKIEGLRRLLDLITEYAFTEIPEENDDADE